MLEFDASIVGGEAPVDAGGIGVALVAPSHDLFHQGLSVEYPAAGALAAEDAEFAFGHVEPTTVLGRVRDL